MYQVVFTKKAEKELDRLSSIDINRSLEKIKLLINPFYNSLDIKKMVNTVGFYRLRVGKVRIIFEIDEKKKEVWIRKIGYRGSVYQY